MFTVHKLTFTLVYQIVRSRVNIVKIGNSRMIVNEKREKLCFLSLIFHSNVHKIV